VIRATAILLGLVVVPAGVFAAARASAPPPRPRAHGVLHLTVDRTAVLVRVVPRDGVDRGVLLDELHRALAMGPHVAYASCTDTVAGLACTGGTGESGFELFFAAVRG
jgi:hypothetical protein